MAAANGALACLLVLITTCLGSAHSFESFAQAKWPNHGGGIENLREARHERKLSTHTVANLTTKWRVKTSGDVTATPAIANGMVYFPTWDGEVFAVNEKDGSVLWRKNLTELVVDGSTNETIIYARATPVVEKEYLLVGIYGPGLLLALHIGTGKLLWSTLLDANPYAVITMSGTVYESAYYVGISSLSETTVEPCCNFQGSMVKVDIKTGKILWRTKMIPDNGNKIGLWSGAAIWGSSPSIDCKRRMIYLATGNLYSTPPDVTACEAEQQNKTVRDVPDPCLNRDDHSESIVALDLDSGGVRWANKLGGYDTWVISCDTPGGPQPNCPPIVGPDYDFGEAPMMLTIPRPNKRGHKWLDVVIAGQKSGVVWALERDNGTLVWDTVSGPGSALGGSMWGMTTDGERVFTNVVNLNQGNFTLVPSNEVTTSGGWVAINASSGQVLWSVAVPDSTYPYGPLSSANGVVFAPSMGPPNGTIYALDPKSGHVLWRHIFPGWVQGGASISDGCIYVGEGSHPANVSVAIPSAVNAICLPK